MNNKTYTYYNKYAAFFLAPLVPLALTGLRIAAMHGARIAAPHIARYITKKTLPIVAKRVIPMTSRWITKKSLPALGRALPRFVGINTRMGKVIAGGNFYNSINNAYEDRSLFEKGGLKKALADAAFSTILMGNSYKLMGGVGNIGKRILGKHVAGKTVPLVGDNVTKTGLPNIIKDKVIGTTKSIATGATQLGGAIAIESAATVPYNYYTADIAEDLDNKAARARALEDYYINNPSVNVRTLHQNAAFYK